MKTFTLTEAKKRLATVLDKARAGEAIEVTRYGKPVFVFHGNETVIVHRHISPEYTRRTFGRLLAAMRRPKSKAGAPKVGALLADVRAARARALGIE